jgi:hypothetical protein
MHSKQQSIRRIPIEHFESLTRKHDVTRLQSGMSSNPRRTTFSSMISSESCTSTKECESHGKPLEINCKTCKIEVCVDCALFYDHRGHQIERNNCLENELQGRQSTYGDFKERAENLLNQLIAISDGFEDTLQRKKCEVKEQIEKGFCDLKAEIESIRSSTIESVAQYYERIETSFREKEESLSMKLELFIHSINKKENSVGSMKKELINLESVFEGKSISDPMYNDCFALSFDINTIQSLKNYCKFESMQMMGKKHSVLKLGEEDNLLQESFTDSVFKDLGETATRIDERILESFHSEVRPFKHPGRSESFHFQQFVKPVLPKEYKMSVCEPTLNGRISRVQTVFRIDDEAVKKSEKFQFPSAMQKQTLTPRGELQQRFLENSQGPVKNHGSVIHRKAESQLLSDRSPFQRFDTSAHKRQSSRPQDTPRSEQRNINWSNRPPSTKNIQKSQAINLTNFGLDDAKLEAYFKQTDLTPAIKTLTLNGNQITDRGIKFVLKEITPLNVENLYLAENNLKEKSLDYLLSFSKYNNSLKVVFMQDNKIDAKLHENKTKILKLKKSGIQVFL